MKSIFMNILYSEFVTNASIFFPSVASPVTYKEANGPSTSNTTHLHLHVIILQTLLSKATYNWAKATCNWVIQHHLIME